MYKNIPDVKAALWKSHGYVLGLFFLKKRCILYLNKYGKYPHKTFRVFASSLMFPYSSQ